MSDIDLQLVSTSSRDGATSLVFGASADGRYVLVDEVDPLGNNSSRLLLIDTATSTFKVVYTEAPGENINSASLSADGRYVAYDVTPAGQLTDQENIYRWDSTNGHVDNVAPSLDAQRVTLGGMMSGDGRYVAFYSRARDLVPGDTNGDYDVFVADMQQGGIRRIFEHGAPYDISEDGRYLIVGPSAVTGDPGVYRVDLQTGAMDSFGANSFYATLSADGRYAAFSTSDALVPEDNNGKIDVYLKDFVTGSVRLVSSSAAGGIGNDASNTPIISQDGSRVAFYTDATNLVAGQSTRGGLIVKDIASGAVAQLPGGERALANEAYFQGIVFISSDNRTITYATNDALLPADNDTLADVYQAHFRPPSVTIANVSGDNRVNAAEEAAPVTVAGTSSAAGLKILVTSPSGATATTTTAADGSWSVTVAASGVSDGTHTFTVKATDDAGITATDSQGVLFDSIPPSLAINIGGGDTINAAQLHAAAIFGNSDAIGQSVTISIDGHVVGHATVQTPAVPGGFGDWSFSYDAGALDEGQHTLDVRVADPAGNVTDRSIFFDVDTAPPRIEILSVAGDDVVSQGELGQLVAVTGTSDATGRTVTITANNKVRGTAVVQADGSWSADISLADASPQTVLFASVADRAGNIGSDVDNVTVDTDLVRVSVGSHGEQGDGDPSFVFGFTAPTISPDGRYVLFTGNPTTLTPDDPDVFTWIMLKDMMTGTLTVIAPGDPGQYSPGSQIAAIGVFDPNGATFTYELIDPASGGLAPRDPNPFVDENGQQIGSQPSLSADGRFLVFTSFRTDLVAGLPAQPSGDAHPRVFVKDLSTGEIKLVSFTATDDDPDRVFTAHSNIGGSRYVAFQSHLSGGANDTNHAVDIYVRDIETGALTLVSATPSGMAGDGDSFAPEISADGRYVAFFSGATNLVAGHTYSTGQVYLRDLQTGTTTLLSADADGNPLGGTAAFGPADIVFTADNRYVAFYAAARAAPEDQNDAFDVYLKDLQTGEVRLISSGGVAADGNIYGFDLTPDGRYATYSTYDPAVPGDTNHLADVFLRRLVATDTLAIDPLTGDNHLTVAEQGAAVAVSGTSTLHGGTVALRIDGAQVATAAIGADGTWATTIDVTALAAGRHAVAASALDPTGFSVSGGAIIMLDRGAQQITVALAHDTGVSASDKITSDPMLTVTLAEPGDTIKFSTDNIHFTTAQPVFATDGFKSVFVHSYDGNGTVTAEALFSFDLARGVGQSTVLTVDDTADHRVNPSEAAHVAYTVAGLDADASGIVTFSDGTHTATQAVSANGSFTIDLSALSGTVTSALALGDLAGNSAHVSGNAVLLAADPDQNAHANHPPVAAADTGSLPAFTTRAGNMLANDSDPDGDTLSLTEIAINGVITPVAASGSTTILGAHGKLTVTADGGYSYLGALPGTDTFAYKVSDGGALAATSTFTVAVSPTSSSSLDFDFAFTQAHVVFTDKALLIAPDGVVYDVTGIAQLHFTDGTINERDDSPLVDDLFYYSRYFDVWAAHIDPDAHYAANGWLEGRDPNAYFSTRGYLGAYADVAAAHVNPLAHYDQYGWREGRDPSPAFDTGDYLAHYGDVAAAHVDPLAHFLAWGMVEGRHAYGDGAWG
jgi:Tol biopolymer transport system component